MEMKNSEGKRGTGLLAVVSRINEEMLSSPNDKKLTKSSVHRAVSRGQFGVSPVKNGRPSKVPPELYTKLASSLQMRKWYWKRQSGLQCWMLRQRRRQN